MNKMNCLKFSTQTAETGIHYLLREIRFTVIHMADGRLFQGLMFTGTVSMFHNSHSTAFYGRETVHRGRLSAGICAQ